MCIESVITFTYIGQRDGVLSTGRMVKYAPVEFQDYQPSYRQVFTTALPARTSFLGVELIWPKLNIAIAHPQTPCPYYRDDWTIQMFINKTRSRVQRQRFTLI